MAYSLINTNSAVDDVEDDRAAALAGGCRLYDVSGSLPSENADASSKIVADADTKIRAPSFMIDTNDPVR